MIKIFTLEMNFEKMQLITLISFLHIFMKGENSDFFINLRVDISRIGKIREIISNELMVF